MDVAMDPVPDLLDTALKLGPQHFDTSVLMQLTAVQKALTKVATTALMTQTTMHINFFAMQGCTMTKSRSFLSWCRNTKTFDSVTHLTVECPMQFFLPYYAASTCDDTGRLWRSAYYECPVEKLLKRFPHVHTLHLVMHAVPSMTFTHRSIMPPPKRVKHCTVTYVSRETKDPDERMVLGWGSNATIPFLQTMQNAAPVIHRVPSNPVDPVWADPEFRRIYAKTINLRLNPNVLMTSFTAGHPTEGSTVWLPLNMWANAFDFEWPCLEHLVINGPIHVQMLDEEMYGGDLRLRYLPVLKSIHGSGNAVVYMDDNMSPSIERLGGSDCVVMMDRHAIPDYTDVHQYPGHVLERLETLWPPEPYPEFRTCDLSKYIPHRLPRAKHLVLRLTTWNAPGFDIKLWGLEHPWPEGVETVSLDLTHETINSTTIQAILQLVIQLTKTLPCDRTIKVICNCYC